MNQEINVKSELLSAFENRISTISTEEKEDIVKRRIGQDILREHLIGTQKKCLLTGIRNKDLLRVSHIKPWAQCESTSTRLDPDNCLLLSALWDAAFDRGLITFSQEGTLKFSQDITEELDKLGSCNEHISFDNIIDMDNHLEHLRWHRENIFRGDAP
ncbi:hypothetical protein BV61_00295 [Candidatus Synechococcus spongiarum LMB bulk15M]|uniref:HNH nuclease domain-containing protein n=1 Tax=Candidatus Synechococcus spongiarum LMB bulk15M TaxID=1943582 RepID=A0A1T1D462_9SYNE|nr:hypothetical protein BV61_00295 [Candidatus Synechococcus spongiarum LMB bulk15M]